MVIPHSTVRLLHLSDLHGASRTSLTNDKWWEHRIKNLAGALGFDAVICSGDIGDNGTEESLRSGFAYLKHLCELAGGTAHTPVPLIVTPGNQDVVRPEPNDDEAKRTQTRFGNFRRAMLDSGVSCIAPLLELSGDRHYFTPSAGGIVIVPICTTWVSGDLPLEYRRKIESLKGVDPVLIDKFMGLLRTDMPFVRTEDIDALIQDCLDPTTAVGKQPLRIAVAHHPLWALPPVESTYRGFDIVGNGMEIAGKLEDTGFQFILNGHKHYLGCSLLTGVRHRFGPGVVRVNEILSLSGGQFTNPDDVDRFGMHTVEIARNGYGGMAISIREYTRMFQTGVEICNAVIAADADVVGAMKQPGRHIARWVHIRGADTSQTDERLNCHLHCNVVTTLGVRELVNTIDSKVITPRAIAEGDKFLSIAVRSIQEFAAGGSRGVDETFVKEITGRAKSPDTQAMVFVDYSGDGTWGRPDLIENAASLFRVYIERNHDVFAHPSPARGWQHPLPEIETAVSDKLGSPRTTGDAPILELHFDLARILVWKPEALYAPSALVLLNLHKVFGVPLFFVDAQVCSTIRGVHDFHLEWGNTQQEPNGGMYLNSHTGRREFSEQASRQKDWITVKELLQHARNPFEVKGTQLDWLLR